MPRYRYLRAPTVHPRRLQRRLLVADQNLNQCGEHFSPPLGSRLFPVFYENAGVFRWRLPHLDSISALLMRPLNGPLLTDRFSQCPC